ncbi:HNH endonuclease signature motif containing protein [Vibrio cortegadensis]|uniref:HNH endonuclease n=1 Tax=Vibrio cortegadensis TaxID=1328770 RepID=UPI0021C47ED4|nr:HNH endonuclease signature motif containing protein [Vibrio cortegadensis]MDN3695888.1 HNH endonuclease signature motif containing protein [Vibrio cortegadensis]
MQKQDILNAVKRFLELDRYVDSYKDSTKYGLVVDGQIYPPKTIFGLAMEKVLYITVKSKHFRSGFNKPCFDSFNRLGFEICVKDSSQNESSSNKDSRLWTKEELSEAVDAYLEMQHKAESGIAYKKSVYYKQLADKFNRTPKAFGRRMSNITYIMTLMDLPTVSGLAPLANVGKTQAPIIEKLISEKLGKTFIGVGLADAEMQSIINSKKPPEKPVGDDKPDSVETTTKTYKRSGKVKGWVIRRANKHCELCGDRAPFDKEDGTPFLEVHHLIRLKDNGPDTVENCAALCPNCHRKLHYSAERVALTEELREKVIQKESGL